ncbi:hypothetical protein Q0Z83_020570 [Actinoplanes sichuanensis]|uniref:Uncharacterized protein n=1 Tax=Actinoplanes sichuanensis TaxID=512349 RepID=A0ABW4AK38_9ACTN|nr:hypothetical protein [Actinoplanes sichuanensis]BEL03866.1 hypothetical protein Q0Z83_020570 [Actinoplanes sichuanensis]
MFTVPWSSGGTRDAPTPAWPGLRLDVAVPRVPGLRVEATGGRRLLIRQGAEVVLLARQRRRHRGVHYLRTGAFSSPLPPITAADARRVGQCDDAAWPGRWTHRFARWLCEDVAGPLHDGEWMLAWGMPRWSVPAYWQRVPEVDPDLGHITWFGYGDPVEDQRDILPLRRLSPIDADRVKGYRRQHREGILPPVLLWWVSGLGVLLVVDGHDRLVAARAEGGVPDVIVLARAADPDFAAFYRETAVRGYEERVRSRQDALPDPFTATRIAHLGHSLALDLRTADRAEGRTRAWPIPGGPAAWDRLATALASDSPLVQDG